MESKKYVAYYRVSTKEQGISGLGLNDQVYQIENTVGKSNIVEVFEEIESGRKKRRIELEKAIALCKEKGYTLVISKLDRLGRIASHLHAIRDNIDLLCVDKPNMSTLEFGIYAGMAQEEAEKISQRTKAALAAKKRQGFKLGNPQNFNQQGREKGGAARRKLAMETDGNIRAFEIARDLRKEGLSLRKIAEKLERYTGKKYYASSVRNLINLYTN